MHANWSVILTGVGAVAALIGATITIVKVLRDIKRQNEEQLAKQDEQRHKQELFDRDWYGSAARPGVPAQPGVVERLGNIETNTRTLPERVTALEGRMAKTEDVINAHMSGHIPI